MDIEDLKIKMDSSIKHLEKEFQTIRTSRANPSMLENIFVGTDISTLIDLGEGPGFTVRTSNSERGNKRIFEPGSEVYINMELGAARLLVD